VGQRQNAQEKEVASQQQVDVFLRENLHFGDKQTNLAAKRKE